MSQMIAITLSLLIGTLPQIIVATVGLILVHAKLKQLHPRAYFYGNIGLALLLLNALWRVLSQAYLQAHIVQGQDRLALTNMLTMANLAGFVVQIGSSVFILVALLADRDLAKSSRGAAQQIVAAVREP